MKENCRNPEPKICFDQCFLNFLTLSDFSLKIKKNIEIIQEGKAYKFLLQSTAMCRP